MKKTNSIHIKFILVLFITFFSAKLYAQKLPKTQEANIKIPSNLRIDGKALEWEAFQAYNPTTGIYYTVANNADNLYLTIQARDPDIIGKIIFGAVTFTISKSDDKKDKSAASITFPIYDRKEGPAQINLKNEPKISNSQESEKQTDSFINVINQKLISKTKLIGVNGIKSLKDSVISIYNEDGIKAIARFDKRKYLTYELLIPLKYLDLSVHQQLSFNYNIKLNGGAINGANVQLSSSGAYILVSGGNGNRYALMNNPQNKVLSYPTDFWGKYTLSK